MSGFFDFFNTHRSGILVFLLFLLVLMLAVNWLAWLFAWGRFKIPNPTGRRQNLRYIFSDATVKIINDFRHLLALFLVFIFAFVLIYAMIRAGGDIEKLKDSIQVVVASLGGLVGSIIGYYFGESAITKANEGKAMPLPPSDEVGGTNPTGESIQAALPQEVEPPIAEAPTPPGLLPGNQQ